MICPENLPTACPQDAKTALVLTLTALQLKVLAALAALELKISIQSAFFDPLLLFFPKKPFDQAKKAPGGVPEANS